MKSQKWSVLILVLCLAVSSPSWANRKYGVDFLPVNDSQGSELVLKGVGLKKVFMMRAFVAGFYLGEDVESKDALKDVPRRIEVYYFVKVPGRKLQQYTEKMMRLNMTKEEFGSVKERIKQMGNYFVDLKPGDRYALTYIPQEGTRFEHNGKVVGTIEGEDFARGLFAVWIGGKPMDERIKRQILGLERLPEAEAVELSGLSEDFFPKKTSLNIDVVLQYSQM